MIPPQVVKAAPQTECQPPGVSEVKKEASALSGWPLELMGLFSAGIVLLGAFGDGQARASGGDLALGKQVFDANCGMFSCASTTFLCDICSNVWNSQDTFCG